MIIPQYTIRWMLGLTTVCAVIFSVFAMAMRGNGLALGVSLAIVSLVLVFLVHAAIFGLVWLFSVITVFRPDWEQLEESEPAVDRELPASPSTLD